MINKYRSHNCSEINEKDVGKTVSISGWLHRKKNHGNLLFIDLRDHYGLTQCVIENKSKYFPILEKSKPESVLNIKGKVVKRERGTENLNLSTGKIDKYQFCNYTFRKSKNCQCQYLENKIILRT